jgi:hypothetical protein
LRIPADRQMENPGEVSPDSANAGQETGSENPPAVAQAG